MNGSLNASISSLMNCRFAHFDLAACGRSGEYEHALRLFRNMKEQGLAADRVAYNALFNALKIAEKPDIAYEIWGEMCGTRQSNTTALATARSDRGLGPDIISVTDCIGALSVFETKDYKAKVDAVFAEAVKRGVVLQEGNLDSRFEKDLSGMTFPVARAAVRYVVNGVMDFSKNSASNIEDLIFITGVGRSASNVKGSFSSNGHVVDLPDEDDNRPLMSLRDYVQQMLQEDFHPPLHSYVPKREQGSVQIDKSELLKWLRTQKR